MCKNKVVKLAYGKKGFDLRVPVEWNTTVVEPHYVNEIPDAGSVILKCLRKPDGRKSLKELVKKRMKVGIIFNDITRPTPSRLIIETILSEINDHPKDLIILFNALGTHRVDSDMEIRSMLGDYLTDNFKIVQNNAFDKSTQTLVGTTNAGTGVWINKELMSCDIRILTGFIEPHFFAGFSGGGKAIMPGMAGLDTILGNHNAKNIGNEKASWGITKGNPIWEEINEVLEMTGNNFLLNVTLNRNKEITAVFAGNPKQAHEKGIAYAHDTATVPVYSEYDIVITTNSGYPLDQNLYQCVKGMSAAARIVRKGGAIIIVAECIDGIPEHGLFGELLRTSSGPSDLLAKINSSTLTRLDQWQAQILAQIQIKADLFICSPNLTDDQLHYTRINRCSDVNNKIEELRTIMGKDAKICVIPEGPQTIPYLI